MTERKFEETILRECYIFQSQSFIRLCACVVITYSGSQKE